MAALTGLVLAGGQSRRMGTDKARLDFDGAPLLERVASRLGEVTHPVLVASGTPGRLGSLPWAEVADAEPGAGPLAGILAGLAAAPTDLVAVVAVDLPYASPALLSRLAELLRSTEAAVAVPVTDDGPQPLHAVWSRRALPGVQAALEADTRRVRTVLDGLQVAWAGPEVWSPIDPEAAFARNVNRPEDLGDVRG